MIKYKIGYITCKKNLLVASRLYWNGITSSLSHCSLQWLKTSVNQCTLNKTVKRHIKILSKIAFRQNKLSGDGVPLRR